MSQQKPYPLRMSDEMRSFLQERADKSGRSLNAEIVKRLQFTIDEEIDSSDGDGVKILEGLRISRAANTLPPGTVLTSQEIYNPHSLSDELREVRELLASIRNVMTDEMRENVQKELKKKRKSPDCQ
ncbi:Arc family DNA-binding protein [Aeromonas jandaei]